MNVSGVIFFPSRAKEVKKQKKKKKNAWSQIRLAREKALPLLCLGWLQLFNANVFHESEGQAGHFGARSFGHFWIISLEFGKFEWSSNFLRKVALKRERRWLRCHLVPPTLCSSRKYLYPSPDEGQQIFREERGPKDAYFRGGGGGGWLLEVFQLTAALFRKLSVILLLTVF